MTTLKETINSAKEGDNILWCELCNVIIVNPCSVVYREHTHRRNGCKILEVKK